MGKRRKKGEGSIRQRKDGRWEGRVVVGYDEKACPGQKTSWPRRNGSARKS